MKVQHSLSTLKLRGCRNISSDKKKGGPRTPGIEPGLLSELT